MPKHRNVSQLKQTEMVKIIKSVVMDIKTAFSNMLNGLKTLEQIKKRKI